VARRTIQLKNLRPRDDAAEQDDGSRLSRAAGDLVRRLVDLGIDGRGPLPAAGDAAASARRRHPRTEDAVAALVASATRSAAVGGFVTGLGGFVTLPVALPANVLGFYVIATRTVAGVAALRGYDLSDPRVRSAVLLTLAADDAQSVLSRFGVGGRGGLVARLARGQLSGPALGVLNKAVGFQLISRFARTGLVGRLGRGVPFAGGLIGAGSDAWVLRRIARAARDAFPEQGADALAERP
jgi:hypothetical protein